jgi:hypothetical protein
MFGTTGVIKGPAGAAAPNTACAVSAKGQDLLNTGGPVKPPETGEGQTTTFLKRTPPSVLSGMGPVKPT